MEFGINIMMLYWLPCFFYWSDNHFVGFKRCKRIKLKLQLSPDLNPSKMVSCDLFYTLKHWVIFPATSNKAQHKHLKNFLPQIIWTYWDLPQNTAMNGSSITLQMVAKTHCQETPKLPCDTPSKAGPNKAPAVNIAAPWGTKSCSNQQKQVATTKNMKINEH